MSADKNGPSSVVHEYANANKDVFDLSSCDATVTPFAAIVESSSEVDPKLLQKENELKLADFVTQDHSLRVSASNVAAMAGFHPFKNLPELFVKLVYQGTIGQHLLQRDSTLLGLTIVDEIEAVQNLARQAGTEVQAAVRVALQVKQGTQVVTTVEQANAVKQSAVVAVQAASTRLTVAERKVLTEGVRSAVDTGYGVHQEDAALDLYESKVGYPVEERNAEVRAWPFRKVSGSPDQPDEYVPLRSAEASYIKKVQKHTSVQLPNESTERSKKEQDLPPGTTTITRPVENTFFSILGSIDGIRDELDTGSGDDDWSVRRVIVECKHRLRTIQKTPAIYDIIQIVTYCFMYNVSDGDLVQVLRQRKRANKKDPLEKKRKTPTIPDLLAEKNVKPSKTSSGEIAKKSSVDAVYDSTGISLNDDSEMALNGIDLPEQNAQATKPINSKKPVQVGSAMEPNVTLSVTRVSVHDPVQHHGQHWHSIILPRLGSFVAGVYSVRRNDDKRYRLLSLLSSPKPEDAWQIVFDECPWLRTCDTAFHNGRL